MWPYLFSFVVPGYQHILAIHGELIVDNHAVAEDNLGLSFNKFASFIYMHILYIG